MNDPINTNEPPGGVLPDTHCSASESLDESVIIGISDTPETNAALVDHMPNPNEWSRHYLDLTVLCRKLERERNLARVPICIGKPIIQILAAKGMWMSENGNSVVAADCLFGNDPYLQNAHVELPPPGSSASKLDSPGG